MNASNRALPTILSALGMTALAAPSLAQPDTERDTEAFCAEALTDDAPEWFSEHVDAAERALERGDLETAQRALGTAGTDLPRTADVSVHPKCVGESLYARHLEAARRATALRAERNPDDWRAQLDAAVLSGAGPASIADLVPSDARAFGTALGMLAEPANSIDFDTERGYFVLDIERAEAETAVAAAAVLRERAGERVDALLEREHAAFTGPVADGDADIAGAISAAESFSAGITGVEPLAGRAETRELLIRTRRSLQTLRELEDWLDSADEASAAAAYERAEARGDALLAAARREAYAYAVRDELYDEAIDYYELARAATKSQTAETERESIQPALRAEREQRREAAEAAEARLREDAEQLGRSAEDLRKTEDEQREFEEEADALEAELGF